MDEISEEKEPEEGNEQDGPVNVTEASFHTTAPGSFFKYRQSKKIEEPSLTFTNVSHLL